jgi:acyl-CoA synthetase (AMP-forming)/AMP-acid ligase II/SAM-dependent methyltransferase
MSAQHLHALFEVNAAAAPERPAVTIDGVTTTYGELNATADGHAAFLRELGLAHGDRVVVYAEPSAHAVAAVIGVLKAGCCVVTTHPSFDRRKLLLQIADSDAAVLVTDRPEHRDFTGTDLDAVLLLDNSPLVRERAHRPRAGAGIEVDDDIAAVFYTSGSSADPKGVVIGHRAMTAAHRAVTGYLGTTADDVVLSYTPIGSDFGFYNVMMPLALGGRVVLGSRWPDSPAELAAVINDHRVTAVHAFPTLLGLLCQADTPMPSIRYITSTGQKLSVERAAALRRNLPHVEVHSMYGLTECKRVAGLPPHELDRRPGSVGRPIAGVRAYLVADGIELSEGVGELVVAGDLLMQGYWCRPEETARVLRRNLFGEARVLFTGDLFRRDEDGCLHWLSRADDVFSRSMSQVNPHEVEARLREHPGVADAVVVPVPDSTDGEAPLAVVVPAAAVSEQDLLDHCATALDRHMVPIAVVFRDELPRTDSGKTDRRAVGRSIDPLETTPMLRLADEFDAIASGRDQVPRTPVRSTIRDTIADERVLAYQDALTGRSGPLFHHFLASVPGVLEELARTGVALARLAERRNRLAFYEADAFDGTNGRTLAEFADGRVTTLTSSPNKANEPWFHARADPERSRFFADSLFRLTTATLAGRDDFAPFRDGFDVVHEVAAFQFYGTDRAAQIAHLTQVLKPGGLALFLEKLDHPDPEEYERREKVKDEVHKARYFTPAEIERKRHEMLSRMVRGQVDHDTLVRALGERFAHVRLIWNATNFAHFAASDDPDLLAEFLDLAGPPHVPDGFAFEEPGPR